MSNNTETLTSSNTYEDTSDKSSVPESSEVEQYGAQLQADKEFNNSYQSPGNRISRWLLDRGQDILSVNATISNHIQKEINKGHDMLDAHYAPGAEEARQEKRKEAQEATKQRIRSFGVTALSKYFRTINQAKAAAEYTKTTTVNTISGINEAVTSFDGAVREKVSDVYMKTTDTIDIVKDNVDAFKEKIRKNREAAQQRRDEALEAKKNRKLDRRFSAARTVVEDRKARKEAKEKRRQAIDNFVREAREQASKSPEATYSKAA